jgi:hypothetical protein
MPAINNPPSIHQAKKRRKARKGVSFWLETEEGKGRPLQKQNTQMWPISRGGNRGPGKRRWNHTIPQRKTRLQATKIFNAQDEQQFKSAFFYPTHVSHAKADKSSTKRSLDRVARNPKQKRIARTRNGSPQRYAKRGSEERRRHLISFPRARASNRETHGHRRQLLTGVTAYPRANRPQRWCPEPRPSTAKHARTLPPATPPRTSSVLVGRPPGCRILSKQKEATDEEPSGFRRSRGERESGDRNRRRERQKATALKTS